MIAPVFVDANVIVYSRDSRDAEKQLRAEAWLRRLWERGEGRLSAQVLHEYYATVTRKLRPGMTPPEARSDVRALLAWLVTVPEAHLLEGAFREQDRASLSWWDALIVSAAKASGCRVLLTEDLRDGQDFDGLLVKNPFSFDPSADAA
jgi:predicted nucleic acid-binding protein